jgi:glycosyltransferase involved in cell wall biosynthesis
VGWLNQEKSSVYYHQASAVVIPSVWPEPFGMVGLEAMSYAKPVVAFHVGGIPEWLEDGVTGFLVPPGDVKGMAGKINLLLQNPKTAQEMGFRGREGVKEQFAADRYVAGLMETYHQCIRANTQGVTTKP